MDIDLAPSGVERCFSPSSKDLVRPLRRAGEGSVLPPSQGGMGWVHTPKPLHPSLRAAGRETPRIVKARSSHEICLEHE